jgi:hypothetical protein
MLIDESRLPMEKIDEMIGKRRKFGIYNKDLNDSSDVEGKPNE